MGPRPPVPFVCQVLVKGHFDSGINWLNKFFVRYTGAAPLNIDLTAYATNLHAALVTNLTPLQDATTTFVEVEVTDLSSDHGSVGLFSTATPGTRVGVLLPATTCALVSHKILRHYRGGHPRTYFAAGIQDDMSTTNSWSVDFVAAVNTMWTNVAAQMIVGSGSFNPAEVVNVSYFGGTPPIAHKSNPRLIPLVDPFLAGGSTCSTKIASQRRRIGRK